MYVAIVFAQHIRTCGYMQDELDTCTHVFVHAYACTYVCTYTANPQSTNLVEIPEVLAIELFDTFLQLLGFLYVPRGAVETSLDVLYL